MAVIKDIPFINYFKTLPLFQNIVQNLLLHYRRFGILGTCSIYP